MLVWVLHILTHAYGLGVLEHMAHSAMVESWKLGLWCTNKPNHVESMWMSCGICKPIQSFVVNTVVSIIYHNLLLNEGTWSAHTPPKDLVQLSCTIMRWPLDTHIHVNVWHVILQLELHCKFMTSESGTQWGKTDELTSTIWSYQKCYHEIQSGWVVASTKTQPMIQWYVEDVPEHLNLQIWKHP